MSVFSMIKKGHKAAKEHNAKRAEQERKEAEKPPYRHVPQHAAIDALSGGPSSYREGDRVKIVEQNKRRSAMTASGLGMSGMMTPVHSGMMTPVYSGAATPVHSGMPRTNSSLSYVSYPAAYASPVVQMPRAYSYSSMTPGWFQPGHDMSYTPVEHPSAMTSKGKEVERVMTNPGRGSRSSSKGSNYRMPVESGSSKDGSSKDGSSKDGGVSPVGSSSGSTSSQDDLEMKSAKPTADAAQAQAPVKSHRPTSEIPDYFHRLHPSSHSRKTSDPAHSPGYYPPQARNPYSQYAPRPGPPSRTNSNDMATGAIPPIPSLPQAQFAPASRTAISAASSTSSVTMVPMASTHSLPPKVSTPAEEISEYTSYEGPLAAEPPMQVGNAVTTPALSPLAVSPSKQERRSRRLSKTTRFTELETIDSNISSFSASLDFGFSTSKDTVQVAQTLVTQSPTLSASSPTSPALSVSPQQRKGKLSKAVPRSGPPPAATPKAKKTNRWSLRGNKTAAVAV